jgi:putative transposase
LPVSELVKEKRRRFAGTRRCHDAAVAPDMSCRRYFLMDQDTDSSASFRQIVTVAGTEPVRLPPRSPNLNAHIERFWRSLREECTDRMIFFGEVMLRLSVLEFVRQYHGERNHQGLGNQLIESAEEVGQRAGDIDCRERLGGLLRYYYRQAA